MNLRRAILLAGCIGVLLFVGQALAPVIEATPPAPAIIQLTNDHANDVRPVWSPDNRMIAFQSNRVDPNVYHIYVMNADGSHQRALTQGSTDDRHPFWMPDGKAILFDSSDGNQSEIWMVNVADGSRKQITHIGGLANFPSVSPDGQHIAFYVYQNETLDLWTARLDGSGATQLTHGLASAANNQCTFACHQAAWSPDNRTIAYSAGELDTIWTVASDGSHRDKVISNGEDNHFPWYMPDGRLGYITEHVNPVQSWTDAWIYDPKSGQSTLLQGHMSPQGPFDWNNNATQVLFHSPRSGNFEIYLVDLNAPGGVDALQGKSVPVQQSASAQNSTGAAPLPSANAQENNLTILGIAAAFGAAVAASAFGLLIRRRIRNRGRTSS